MTKNGCSKNEPQTLPNAENIYPCFEHSQEIRHLSDIMFFRQKAGIFSSKSSPTPLPMCGQGIPKKGSRHFLHKKVGVVTSQTQIQRIISSYIEASLPEIQDRNHFYNEITFSSSSQLIVVILMMNQFHQFPKCLDV